MVPIKTLIIAEKPSLTKNICAALSQKPQWHAGKNKNSGYYENDEYVVSYAFGHLLRLNDADDYDAKYKSWQLEDLPIVPKSFLYKTPSDAGAKAQLALLKQLIARSDIDKVVNAGDSDREGEIIVRNILHYAKCKKPVYRLWMPDQTPKTIRAELAGMKSDAEYDNLAYEGYARTYIDWLFGINLTRYVTKRAERLFRIGRVTSPIVVAICEREREINAFKPVTYYVAQHDEKGLKLSSQSKDDAEQSCKDRCTRYNGAELVVTGVTTAEKKVPRPKLFALSDLQGAAGKACGFSPKKTLDVLQTLYEAGFTSYPRTDARYMATNEKQKAKGIIKALGVAERFLGNTVSFRDSTEIFDSSKIEAHSAITPTESIPKAGKLTLEQTKIYNLIVNRFMAAFYTEEYILNRTTMTIDNGFEQFRLNGDVLVSKGFTVIEPVKSSQSTLPSLKKGDKISSAFKPIEKQTTPPDHYTAETLNAYLKNPYSKSERTADAEAAEVELGTEATRAGLIDAAIKSGYITLIKNRYGITPDGEQYTDTLAALDIDMTKSRTLELSKSLKQVYKGLKTVDTVVADAESNLSDICKNSAVSEFKPKKTAYAAKKGTEPMAAICKCPKCGKNIIENPKAYSCEDKECGCVIFKDDHFFAKLGKPMTVEIAKDLFTKKCYDGKGFVSSKTGKTYDAKVTIDFSGKYANYHLEFPESK